MSIDLTAVITALFVLIQAGLVAWFNYNQKNHERSFEEKLKQNEVKVKNKHKNEATITGMLWSLLHEFEACRVYVVQPHPLSRKKFLSISFEVLRRGVAPMVSVVQARKIETVAVFAKDLANRDFVYYKDVKEVKDKKAKSILSANGTKMAVIKRLYNDDWVGNIICEFTTYKPLDPIFIKNELTKIASEIQLILPEYEN